MIIQVPAAKLITAPTALQDINRQNQSIYVIMIGKMSFTCAIFLACVCQISMAGVISPVVAAPFAAAPLVAAPLAAAPVVGYAHAVPHNIPPHASRVDISTRALAAPYIAAPAVSAPIISAPTGPGLFAAPFAAYRSAAIFG